MDRMLSFTIPARNARGRAVRLGPVLDQVLAAHDYPPVIRDLLAEALVLVALLGALLKDVDSQLTMQAQTEGGVVDLLVCDYRGGELRGYVQHDAGRLAMLEHEDKKWQPVFVDKSCENKDSRPSCDSTETHDGLERPTFLRTAR
jgi:redox-regulated HSP33 family molecular chaperone